MNEISSRYASALFSLAEDTNKINEWQLEVKELKKILDENEDFIHVLGSSFMSHEEKNRILEDTLKGVDENIVALIKIVVSNNRSNYLLQVCEDFNTLCNESRGVVEGYIYSTEKLDEKLIQRIEEKISHIEKKKVELKNKIDPTLIGGIKVAIHDHIYDGSIKNQITQMKMNLLKKEDDQYEN